MMTRWPRVSIGLVVATYATSARAQPPDPQGRVPGVPVDVRADEVVVEGDSGEVRVRGDVRIDASPFFLRSEEIKVARSRRGVEVEGRGRLAFCPCLGTPLAVQFDGATVAPPGDVLVKSPTLQLYGVPIAWLPFFWFRSNARVGALPPELAYRGDDGFYAGAGVHLPLGADAKGAIQVRGGAYIEGGAVVDVRMRTTRSVSTVRWDRLRSSGLLFDTRGSMKDGAATGAWDIDALRGTRAVRATTSLETASRRYDRARSEANIRDEGWSLAASVSSTAPRGGSLEELGVIGPRFRLARSSALGDWGTYDAAATVGQWRGMTVGSLTVGQGEARIVIAPPLDVFDTMLELRGLSEWAAADFASRARHRGVARLEAAVPFGRGFGERGDVQHRIAPLIAGTGVASAGDESHWFGVPMAATGALAEAGIHQAVGTWARRTAAELRTSGAILVQRGDAVPLARWQASAQFAPLAVRAEGAHASDAAHVVIAHTRIGPLDGLHLRTQVAGREGLDPSQARLVAPDLPPVLVPFLAEEGWTAGSSVRVPWGRWWSTEFGMDGDLSRRQWLGTRASIRWQDRCHCLVARAFVSERLGRPGLDAWVTVDFAP